MSALLASLSLLLGAAEVTAAAPVPAGAPAAAVEEPVTPTPGQFHARFELGQTFSDDGQTGRHLSWTDLRITADATNLTSADLFIKLDGRGRYSWNTLTDSRVWITDLSLRQGSPEANWRFTLGRQTVRALGSAQVDGLSVERRLGPTARLVAFAGLMPQPITSLPNLDFTTAGLGYELGAGGPHAGGLVLSLYRFSLDRLYLTHRSTVVISSQLTLTGLLIADLLQPEGLFGKGTPDLTSGLLLFRYRPARALDLTLSASHQHTIVPGVWWRDWMNDELQKRGFVIDGIQPLGTRITSARLTANFPSRLVVPYLRLRFDVRHSGVVSTGFEGLAGVRVRPGKFFGVLQGGWRRYFEAQAATVSADVGLEEELVSFQVGGAALYRMPLTGTGATLLFEAHATVWLDVGQLIGPLKGVLLSAQYEGLYEPAGLYHVGSALIGYRF